MRYIYTLCGLIVALIIADIYVVSTTAKPAARKFRVDGHNYLKTHSDGIIHDPACKCFVPIFEDQIVHDLVDGIHGASCECQSTYGHFAFGEHLFVAGYRDNGKIAVYHSPRCICLEPQVFAADGRQ